jgi:phosphate starvation-inducible protein PhoH and related proteins
LAAAQDNHHPAAVEVELEPVSHDRLAGLCGPLDENLRLIERRLGVEINNRGNRFRVIGLTGAVDVAGRVLSDLYAITGHDVLTAEKVQSHLQSVRTDAAAVAAVEAERTVRTKRGTIRGRSPNQRLYLQNILDHDISFGIGPAGTGKTYLAVACAVAALEEDRVRRIVLVRPAVEAGEKLGYLPGDLVQKVDPYLRPLYDALYEMLGFERVAALMERSIIEVAPLAFMRGRTLNDAFVILDEAQNTTREQMKMFLTRIGFGSTAVITGDVTQIDLPNKRKSGLKHAVGILQGVKGISFCEFSASDVVRHPLVQHIVEAYEAEKRDPDDD